MNLKLPATATRRGRPPFTRTASNSSAKSTASEDSFIATLKSLTVAEGPAQHRYSPAPSPSLSARDENKVDTVSGSTTNNIGGTLSPSASETPTPGRKSSRPIAIELPGKERRTVHTPLSARGELQGGYFPHHEDIQRSYQGHNFDAHLTTIPRNNNIRRPISSPAMSNTSSPMCSPRDSTPTQRHHYYPGSPNALPVLQAPELYMPRGKYYPSNYQKPGSSSTSSSPKNPSSPNTSRPTSGHAQFPLPQQLTPARPSVHARRPSEVKQKLQQYQRQMMQQAQMSISKDSAAASGREGVSPIASSPGPLAPALPSTSPPGPKLVPVVVSREEMAMGMGVITPLELEGPVVEVEEYLMARHGGREAVSA